MLKNRALITLSTLLIGTLPSLGLAQTVTNVENGGLLGNSGSGTTLTNTSGSVISVFSGYLDGSGTLHPNTTGFTSTLLNYSGAVIDNGDVTGLGLILIGGYTEMLPFVPGNAVNLDEEGAYLLNSTAIINNQNGSHLDNYGAGAVITNTAGGVINNYSGYLDSSGNYNFNNTGYISMIRNESGAVINNGDSAGLGLILNGGYTESVPFVPGNTMYFYSDGAQLLNSTAIINNQNGSHLDNYGAGAVITNTAGAILDNYSGYVDSSGTLQANTTGYVSTIKNEFGAVINNGDGTGAGLIVNGGYSNQPFIPGGSPVYLDEEGAALLNSGAVINNQNGSHLDNWGVGAVLTNTAGAILDNYSGYVDSSGTLQANTTGYVSTIKNEFGAVINNGDGTGAGLIVNGGYSNQPFIPGGSPVYLDEEGAALLNSGAVINNQNGSHLDNWGVGAVLTNTAGAILDNYSGYVDSSGTLQANTTGYVSTIKNEFGAVINNGDGTGAGLIVNGGYSNQPFIPGGSPVYLDEEGAALLNSGAVINNQNGSHLDNWGVGAVLTNTAGAILDYYSGYVDSSGTLQANTTGYVSTIKSEFGAVINNGDGTGAGLIVNGGYSNQPFIPGGSPVYLDEESAALLNSGAVINNQNGSHLDNWGVGAVLTNTAGAILDNYSGYVDSSGTLQANTTGYVSTIKSEFGAVINNGDGTGAGLIVNGGYSNQPFIPGGSPVYLDEEGAALLNSGAVINNQNGSHLDNWGVGAVLTNTAGAILDNYSGYVDSSGTLQANTTGYVSTIKNEFGAVINNGDGTGAGLIVNGGYSNQPFIPGGSPVYLDEEGAALLNSGAVINNQNGSHLDNWGVGAVLTNTAGAILDNYSGYVDSSGTLQANTTGYVSTIKNEFGAVINNGDGTGAGLIVNGGYSNQPFIPGGSPVYLDEEGAALLNSGAVINNQNGSHLDNWGVGAVLTNTAGAILDNYSGYVDSSGTLQANTTGYVSTIKNEFGAVINNGDGTGAGLIVNGGYSNQPFIPGAARCTWMRKVLRCSTAVRSSTTRMAHTWTTGALGRCSPTPQAPSSTTTPGTWTPAALFRPTPPGTSPRSRASSVRSSTMAIVPGPARSTIMTAPFSSTTHHP